MSSTKYKELADLNQVALNEFEVLVNQNENLTLEWKQIIIQLLQSNDIPQNLESIKQLITGEQNAKTRDA